MTRRTFGGVTSGPRGLDPFVSGPEAPARRRPERVLAEGPLRRVVTVERLVWIEENAPALVPAEGFFDRVLARIGRSAPELRCHPAITDAIDPRWRPVACGDPTSGWFWFAPSRATPLEKVEPQIVRLRGSAAVGEMRWAFDLAWEAGSMRLGLSPACPDREPRPPLALVELARALHRVGFAAPMLPDRQQQEHTPPRVRMP